MNIIPHVQLPLELIQQILTVAASSSRRSALDLCLVSSWVRDIAIRCLLHTVVIRNHHDHELFGQFVLRAPTELFISGLPPAHYVETLWVAAVAPHIIHTYNACPNIRHLALVDGALQWLLNASLSSSAFPLSQEASGRTLELHLTLFIVSSDWRTRHSTIWHKAKTSHLLNNITRVRFPDYGIHNGFTVRDLEPFPNLTHLAISIFGWEIFEDRVRLVLNSQTLKMFVMVMTASRLEEEHMSNVVTYVSLVRASDTRLYLAESLFRGIDIQPEWENDMRSGQSIWDRAAEYTKVTIDARGW